MTSAEIRQSFLDFFREKQHTIVPSSSLLPDSPNLLFTNAGMNQFVPIFLGQQTAPYQPPRAADTQKCIRAGGKHNDLDDVGLDTYHHTFFEMLGNWSFGDYFKKEAIEWAWELVVERWGLPPQRLYATVYKPGDGEPSEFDQEAHDHWARLFMKAGLDPAAQIVNGNKKDNFWMMGDTGPCGPCSELHVDLTPNGDTRGSLVNAGDPRCIEIWNLVFIQFNANPNGTFVPLPQRHVDTGMGFERACSIIQGTKGFSDFTGTISNYETDVFRPIFDEIERLSGKPYASTLPASQNVAGSGPPASTSASDVSSSSSGVSTRPSGVSTSSSAVSSLPSVGGGEPSRDDGELSRDAGGSVTAPAAQIAIDIAFRVIADHIRTLSFAIADGIRPSNEGRGYVLRRILRRAVRYGRTLGFREPFFFMLVDVVTATMGNVFPELRAKQQLIRDTLRREEDSFNRTLDKGIALFETEVCGISGRVGVPPAGEGVPPERTSGPTEGVTYTLRRRLPHFEQPWAIYALTISTAGCRKLRPESRTIVLNALRHFDHARYDLIAACVMPDHLHVLICPWVKEQNERGEAVFWSLSELMHSVKSFTAKEINNTEGTTGSLWEQERFDRYVRGDRDLEEKFQYIISNPEREGLGRDYPWVWTQEDRFGKMPKPAGETPTLPGKGSISGAFAFRLYDEQGFPLDLTELMARERGLTVDVAGFEQLMEQQRSRARAAQKKETITIRNPKGTDIETQFVGYDQLTVTAKVFSILHPGDDTAVVVDESPFYAEMGGQVGDTGTIIADTGHEFRVKRTARAEGATVLICDDIAALEAGEEVTLQVDVPRRRAIERHHTVTHLLHWALHEVVSREAAQKGSYVGPEKLTFDFNNAALTPAQLREVEKLVNERIVENGAVSWIEMPYQEVKMRPEIMQFFGDKYGDTVRVVQIGGEARALNGYSMELCGGTHVRGTGEIGLFRIVAESAIAAGVRRIEAVAGLNAYDQAKHDQEFIRSIAGKLNSPVNDLEKRIDSILAQQKVLEKSVKALEQKQAVETARELVGKAQTIGDIPAIIENLGAATGDQLQAIAEALKQQQFGGVAVLAGVVDGTVALVAAVGSEFTGKVQAGKIIQAIAPLVGGKGGGRPDGARGAGKDASKLEAALAHARAMLAS